jgi:hypothetical protein
VSTKIFGIRDKTTKSFERFNRQACWMSVGAAKSSFTAHQTKWDRNTNQYIKPKFDDQDVYEIVELTEYVAMYEGLDK